jgi:hypothetical protein
VALFISTQSGNWHDPLTWDVGAVPDLGVDDVVITDGHEVVLETNEHESLASGRQLVVGTGATLRIQGGIAANGSDVIVAGDLIAEGSHLAIWGGGHLEIDPTGTVTVESNFYLESEGTTNVEGVLTINSGGDMNVYWDAILTVATDGILDFYGYGYFENYSEFHLYGDFQINSGGTLSIAFYGSMTVEQNGVAVIDGTLSSTFHGLIDVFGYLGVAPDGFLHVYSNGRTNVYKDISIGGRMTGGGKVLMLRREGRILDFNDNPIFVLDRAYGFGQTQIA